MRFVLACREKGESSRRCAVGLGSGARVVTNGSSVIGRGECGDWRTLRAGPVTRQKRIALFGRTLVPAARSASALGVQEAALAAAKIFCQSEADPGGEHAGALAGASQFDRQTPATRSLRSGLAVAGAAGRAALQRGLECGFQRLVSHRRWPALRTAHGARCAQSLCPGGSGFVQAKRGGGAPGAPAGFRRYGVPKALRVDNGAPFGSQGALGLSRLSVWWLRLGIAVEFIRRAHPRTTARPSKCLAF